MKSRKIIEIMSITTVFFIFILIIISCQKEKPRNNAENDSSRIKTSVTTATYRGLINSSNSATITVKDSVDEVWVTTSTVPTLTGDYYLVRNFNTSLSRDTLNGEIEIPQDGDVYWLIPFNSSDEPQLIAGGTTLTQTCACPTSGGGNCIVTYDTDDPCNTDCQDGSCTGCKASNDDGGSDAVYFGSVAIVKGEVINFNGIKYIANSISTTQESFITKLGDNEFKNITVSIRRSMNGDTVIIDTSGASGSYSSNVLRVYDIGITSPSSSSGEINVPDNGLTYWSIPIYGNPTLDIPKKILPLYPEYATCDCLDGSSGNCNIKLNSNCELYCENDGCFESNGLGHCCLDTWRPVASVGGVIVAAEAVRFLGTTYD